MTCFYRLAVLRIVLPPLRQRPEDIPMLVEQMLARMAAPDEAAASLRSPRFIERLQGAAWPGNARELRNYLERCLVFEDAASLPGAASELDAAAADADLPYREAARRARDRFERAYVRALLERHGDNVTRAAQAAEIDRASLHRLKQRHRLK